jgi:hypothetical protein
LQPGGKGAVNRVGKLERRLNRVDILLRTRNG